MTPTPTAYKDIMLRSYLKNGRLPSCSEMASSDRIMERSSVVFDKAARLPLLLLATAVLPVMVLEGTAVVFAAVAVMGALAVVVVDVAEARDGNKGRSESMEARGDVTNEVAGLQGLMVSEMWSQGEGVCTVGGACMVDV
jgi:hypothetical protein